MIKLLSFLSLVAISGCSIALFPELPSAKKVSLNLVEKPLIEICKKGEENSLPIYLRSIEIAPPFQGSRIFNCAVDGTIKLDREFEFIGPVALIYKHEFDRFFRINVRGLELLPPDSSIRSNVQFSVSIYRVCLGADKSVQIEAAVLLELLNNGVQRSQLVNISIPYVENLVFEEHLSKAFSGLSQEIATWIVKSEICL